jgi:hypothetical protein
MSIPYDGGAIGAFQSFGTMGRPDYAHGITLAQAPDTGTLNNSFFPQSFIAGTDVFGSPLTVDQEGELLLFYYVPVNSRVSILFYVNSVVKDSATAESSAGGSWYTFRAAVKAGDVVRIGCGSDQSATLTIGRYGYLVLNPRVHDQGSISANSYMTY